MDDLPSPRGGRRVDRYTWFAYWIWWRLTGRFVPKRRVDVGIVDGQVVVEVPTRLRPAVTFALGRSSSRFWFGRSQVRTIQDLSVVLGRDHGELLLLRCRPGFEDRLQQMLYLSFEYAQLRLERGGQITATPDGEPVFTPESGRWPQQGFDKPRREWGHVEGLLLDQTRATRTLRTTTVPRVVLQGSDGDVLAAQLSAAFASSGLAHPAALPAGATRPRVAVVDTGIDTTLLAGLPGLDVQHRWLGRLYDDRQLGEYRWLTDRVDHDPGGHGTAVAGLVAAASGPVDIISVSGLGDHPESTSALLVSWALGKLLIGREPEELPHVINLSLAYAPEVLPGQCLRYARSVDGMFYQLADSQGVSIVAAAGNADDDWPADRGIKAPALWDGPIAIGSVSRIGGVWRRTLDSCHDGKSDSHWVLPGGRREGGVVVEPILTVADAHFAGTSFSCALASGALAAWSANLERSSERPASEGWVTDQLARAAEPVSTGGPTDTGHGWLRIPPVRVQSPGELHQSRDHIEQSGIRYHRGG